MDKVEIIARALCKLEGGDPNVLVSPCCKESIMETPKGMVISKSDPEQDYFPLWHWWKYNAEYIVRSLE